MTSLVCTFNKEYVSEISCFIKSKSRELKEMNVLGTFIKTIPNLDV